MPNVTKKRTTRSKAMPKWTPAPESLVRIFEKAMKSVPEGQLRKTFGYPSATLNGNMFTGLHNDKMILRLSEPDRAALARLGGSPFEPMPGRPMKEYVVVPESILKSEAQLDAWLQKALAYSKTLPPKTKSRGKNSTS